MAKRGEKRERRSVVLEPDAAGIDIGAEEIYVAVPPDRDEPGIISLTCGRSALQPETNLGASQERPTELRSDRNRRN